MVIKVARSEAWHWNMMKANSQRLRQRHEVYVDVN